MLITKFWDDAEALAGALPDDSEESSGQGAIIEPATDAAGAFRNA